MAIARGDLASYFAKEAITRFANDPIDIEKDRERGALLPKAPQRNYPGWVQCSAISEYQA